MGTEVIAGTLSIIKNQHDCDAAQIGITVSNSKQVIECANNIL